jgi:predicted glutamine amidotransferase
MCIAILSPRDVTIPYENLVESFESNPDGAGFMYADNEELVISKGFMDFNSFYEAYAPHQEKACAIHFRIKTHGEVTPDNTHPFQVGRHMGVIHNGIINNVDTTDDPSMSDTFHFNAKFLAPIYKRDSRFAYKEHFKDLIKSFIGYSKLVFLNNKGHFSIVNEKAGFWDEGAWYSNRSYLKSSYTVFNTQKKDVIRPAEGPSVFKIGTRVKATINGTTAFGVISYFTGGLQAGVRLDSNNFTTLCALASLQEAPLIVENSPFAMDDWVTRIDGKDNRVGVVTGTSKNIVWVQWMSDDLQNVSDTAYTINANKLQHYDHYSGV